MRGTVGALFGVLVVTLGLIGLGVTLAPMMMQPADHSALISVGGLAAFIAALIVMLLWLRY